MTPHALDITVAIVILLSTLAAYFRGLVREVFMLAGLSLASYVSYSAGHLLVPDVSAWLNAHPGSTNEKASALGGLLTPTIATNVVSYGGIFLGVFIIMVIIRMMISHWVSGAGLTVADRVGGGVFGFARGYLLVLVVFATCLYMAYQGETDQLPEWAKNSVSVPVLEKSLAFADKNFDLKGSLKMIADKIERVNFDKVGKAAGDATQDLKAEVQHEEAVIQKAPPGMPPPAPPVAPPVPAAAAVPVAPVVAAPVPAPPPVPPSSLAPPAP